MIVADITDDKIILVSEAIEYPTTVDVIMPEDKENKAQQRSLRRQQP